MKKLVLSDTVLMFWLSHGTRSSMSPVGPWCVSNGDTDSSIISHSVCLPVLRNSDYLRWLLSVIWLFVLELMRSSNLNSNEQRVMLHTSRKGIYFQNAFLQAHQTVRIVSTAKVSNWHFLIVHLLHFILQIQFKDQKTS